jgi:predicted GNAT superfamily acetyltransferase
MIQEMSNFQFRVATQSDFPAILMLNHQSEQFLSPLDRPKLSRISNEAAFFQVAISAESVVGFLLAFLPEADYDNANFFWFKTRYENFLYIDRIVISEDFRGHHLATSFYSQLEKYAIGQGIPRLACEINVDPPNPVSVRFHQKQGFAEVGQQWIEDRHAGIGKKLVSLQIKEIER